MLKKKKSHGCEYQYMERIENRHHRQGSVLTEEVL